MKPNVTHNLLPHSLVVIDVHKAIDAPYHAADGPDAEAKIARLLARWRKHNRPIIHVRRDSTSTTSAYRPGQIGNDFKQDVEPRPAS